MTDELKAIPGKKFVQIAGFIFVAVGIIVLFYESEAFEFNLPSPAAAAASLWQQATTTWHDVEVSINPPRRDGGLSKSAIADIQARLAQNTAMYPEGIVSGIYGDLTSKAVARFQKKYGLEVTGAADSETVTKIKEVLTAPAKSSGNKTVAPPVTPPKPAPKPGADPIIVRDQFGHAVPRARVWLVDAEARMIPERNAWGADGWEADDNGRIQFKYTPKGTGTILDGHYTIHIEKQNYTTVEVPIESTTDEAQKYSSFSPHIFTLPKQGIIAFVMVDESGKPLLGSFKLIDAQGRQIDRDYAIETGRAETEPIADGQYTLQMHMSDYDSATGRSIEYEAERSVTMTGGVDMFLGNIVLTKK